MIFENRRMINLKGYLFDTHIHTKEASSCGEVPAAEVVKRYKSLGYNGIIVTDHVHAAQFAKHGSTYKEQAEKYLSGYRTAKAFEDENFKVILGMEIRFLENDNDYLLYGFDEDFVFSRDLAHFESLEAFKPVVEENNLIIFQAHPFRRHMTVINPALVDGIEVYNGHGNHNSSNDIAYAWAVKYSLPMLSGSDFHGNTEMEPGGVYFEEYVDNSKAVAQALRDKKYTLKCCQK